MNFLKKWYTYQKERFPILIFGLYVFCIVFGVFCYNVHFADLTMNTQMKNYLSLWLKPYELNCFVLIPMFCVAFLQFLMVRIVDEFKDYEEDCKYRSYRPVPRGLITLKELKILFLICTVLQVGITYLFNNYNSMAYLAITWICFLFMTKGFFIKKFLDKHIIIEVLLDELMMPVLILYLSSFVYYIDLGVIKYLLLLSYLISCIVEIARKVRCKEDEEEGVKTYTAVLGIPKAVAVLYLFEIFLTLVVNTILDGKFLLLIIIVFIVLSLINILFMIEQKKKYAKAVELSSNFYIMLAYLSMGLLLL